jgi:hypothetical protein
MHSLMIEGWITAILAALPENKVTDPSFWPK